MSEMKSVLYRGTVTHTRLKPVHHEFSYRVFYGLFDIDELASLDDRLRLFSVKRWNMFGFDPKSHGADSSRELRPMIERILAPAGVDLGGGRIELLCFPKVLGYAFDPISVWYCYDPGDELRAVIHEVRNTFGDRHLYVVPITGHTDLRHSFEKMLHVSPFNPMDQRYEFTIKPPGERLAVGIAESDRDGVMFRAGLSLSRLQMSDSNLLRLFFTHPLVTLKATFGIHWQALRLWRKGAVYKERPQPRIPDVTVVTTRERIS